MKEPETFITEMPENGLGEWLYGYSSSENIYADRKGNTKKYWKEPSGIFLLLVAAFLVFWFVYSVIFAVIDGGSVFLHLSDGFAVFVMVIIILLSVFGGWGHLVRLEARLRARGNTDSEDYIKATEEQNKFSNSFNVFTDYLVLQIAGEEKIINRNYLETVKLIRVAEGYQVVFVSKSGEEIDICDLVVPYSQFKELKKCFNDKLTLKNAKKAFDGKFINQKIVVPVVVSAALIAISSFFGLPIFSDFKSFHEFLCGFDGLNCGLVFFFSIGVAVAVSGIIALAKLIIYKVDKT